MDIITGYRGEPHITEWQDRTGYAGIVGRGQYILPFGSLLALTNPTGRVLRLGGGILCMNGLLACIREGEYDALAVDPVNTSGYSRIDLVVARYERDDATGVESIKSYVIKGVEALSPTPPGYMPGSVTQNTVGDIIDMPLYTVNVQYNGTITITRIAKVLHCLDDLYQDLYVHDGLSITDKKIYGFLETSGATYMYVFIPLSRNSIPHDYLSPTEFSGATVTKFQIFARDDNGAYIDQDIASNMSLNNGYLNNLQGGLFFVVSGLTHGLRSTTVIPFTARVTMTIT